MTSPIPRSQKTFPAAIVWCALALALAGCQAPLLKRTALGPDYEVSNVFRLGPAFPPDLRRIAVLPLSAEPSSEDDATAAQQSLESVLHTELLKTKRFELIWVSPEQLQHWTGRKSWSAHEKLPQDFFSKLREQTGCDGALFSQVSRYHPYPPLTIGWKLKLIGNSQAQILWAVDEIFDAGEPRVSNSARRYEMEHQKGTLAADSPMILTSPQRFGHYTLSALLGTLPTP